MAKKGKKILPKKVNGYKMPPPIPPGEIIRHGDKEWEIGPSIGVGGFGEIYSARECKKDESSSKDVADYPFVVKIEPEENGPLFVEMHFYNRNYHEGDIQEFMKSRNLSMLGMPRYIGSGTVNIKGEALRFLIVERYGTDLWKLFNQVGKKFPAPTVFQLGLQMIDVLDYIHSRSYIHADIKGANILLGVKEGSENQAYLLDFGLAYRIVDDNYKPDPKSAHEGTIEYTSTDRHIGAKTMRGDLEILGYNLLHWLVGKLPWDDVLDNPQAVYKMKLDFVNNVRARITADYPDVPDILIKFFEYIRTLELKDQPDYSVCRHIFERYLTSVGKTRSSQLEFKTTEENDSPNKVDENQKESMVNYKNKEEKQKLPENASISKSNKAIEVIDYKEGGIKKNKKPVTTDKNSEDITLTESESINELVDSNKEQKVTKNKQTKRTKSYEITDISESDARFEQPDENQKEKFAKSKKDKRHENPEGSSPVKNDDKNEEPGDNQEEQPSENKKYKKQRDNHLQVTSSAENDAEGDQPYKNHKQKVTKVKKTKKENAYLTRTDKDDKREQIYDYQEENPSKNKKYKKQRDNHLQLTSSAENHAESDQPYKNHDQKVKVKKTKKQNLYLPSTDNDDTSEQIYDYQEENIAKDGYLSLSISKNKNGKRKKDKKQRDASPAKNDDEIEQPDDNQGDEIIKVKKNKKYKGKKLKDLPSADNDSEIEQIDDNQEIKLNKKKKNKRKRDKDLRDTSLAENNDENEQSDAELTLIEIVKNKKKKKDEKKAKKRLAEAAENERIENNQDKELTRLSKTKRKKDKKTQVVNKVDSELSDDCDQPMKKRKSSKTPSKKTKKDYPDDSEGETKNKTRNKKRDRIKFDKESSFWPSLPVKQVDLDTAFPERDLRSKNRKTRPNYTGT